MNNNIKFSRIGIVISILLIILKPIFYAKILAVIGLLIFLFMFFSSKGYAKTEGANKLKIFGGVFGGVLLGISIAGDGVFLSIPLGIFYAFFGAIAGGFVNY